MLTMNDGTDHFAMLLSKLYHESLDEMFSKCTSLFCYGRNQGVLADGKCL
jgi:hypothetical protein